MLGFILTFIFLLLVLFIINSIYSKKKYRKLIITTELHGNFIFVNGTKVNYVRKGSGKPLLLLHGFMNSFHFFDIIIDDLARNYTVYAIDIIGFGLSDKRESISYTKKNMANIAKEFMNCQGISNFCILGHSMGGEVALNMAYYYPEDIDKLILVSSAGYVKNRRLFYLIEKSKFLFKLFVKHVFRTYALIYSTFWLALCNKNFFNKEMLYDIFIQAQNIPLKTFYKMSLQNNLSEIEDKPAYIKAPSLLIWGRNDWIVPIKYGKRMNSELQNSKLIIYDNCGHIPFLERKDEFLNQVKDFLQT